MNTIPYTSIAVAGKDAFDFLQAQLAADLNDLAPGGLAAWCNPKGRVICLFRVTRRDDEFLLALPTELTDAAVKRLTMFRFRSEVDFDTRESTPAHLGMEGSYDDWRLANLRGGIPEILSAQSEEFTPHMLNLDLLGAVSVSKGCYPGQEIVARTHFRGATKRRCLRFASAAPTTPGDKVSDGERDVGEVLNAIGNELLAVVPLDKADQQLSVAGSPLEKSQLPYL